MSHAKARLGHSERRICRALGIPRSAVRYEPQPRVDESALTGSIVGLAGQYGRYGYRRFTPCSSHSDDMYYGHQREIFTHREKIKRLTLQRRKTEHLRNAA